MFQLLIDILFFVLPWCLGFIAMFVLWPMIKIDRYFNLGWFPRYTDYE